MEIEKNTNDLKYLRSGILNFQNGINNNKTIPILNEAINMGGTELFKANFAIGNALPCVAIIKRRIIICLKGTISLRKDLKSAHQKYSTKLFLPLCNL